MIEIFFILIFDIEFYNFEVLVEYVNHWKHMKDWFGKIYLFWNRYDVKICAMYEISPVIYCMKYIHEWYDMCK